MSSESISANEIRKYKILGLIGTGGFGRVYRATLSARDGFEREVAVKILTDENPDEEVLQRFRDEARILGLIRDRAIVGVEPPTRLDGKWSVIMDYVDGNSVSQLMRGHGVFPPVVCLEIVEEAARALDKVYHQPGPEGGRLGLLHRDLKPSNLQITRHGELKILDFGLAKADFIKREARTRTGITGTPGYIAPERFEALEIPAGDVFSLGRVLEVMLTGWRPGGDAERYTLDEVSTEARPVLQLAQDMTAQRHAERPTAREVERRCRDLVSELGGRQLREWAELCVAPIQAGIDEDQLVGNVLMDAPSGATFTQNTATLTVGKMLAYQGVAVLGVTGVVGVSLALLAVVLLGVWWLIPSPQLAANPPAPVPVVEAPQPPSEPEAPEPEPTEQPPEPVSEPLPAEAPVEPTPAPEPVENVEPEKQYTITIASNPMGQNVLLEGRGIGRSPATVSLIRGKYRVALETGEGTIFRTIDVGPRRPGRYFYDGVKWETK